MSHRFFFTAVAVVAIGVTTATVSAPRLADAMPTPVMMAGPTQLGGTLTNPGQPLFDSLNSAGGYSIFSHLMADADLTDTLNGPDAYTVFAVPDAVFHKLPQGEVDRISKPDNKAELVRLAAYHIIKGRLDSAQIFAAIEAAGDGKALFRTLQGENITFQRSGRVLEITDAHGDLTDIVTTDIPQANGLIYVLDHPLTPK
jgi:uncharacterized surface protein with fasciclin (FAS1) repeats